MRESNVRTRITKDSLDGFGPFENFGTHGDGAVLIFQGRVRNTNDSRSVSSLSYEAYGEMAERELGAICREANRRFEVGSIEAIHRVGDLALGEVSVAIGITAPHRDTCYAASRWVIEEIKERLPIWKYEHYQDGDSHWVGSPEISETGLDSRSGKT
jgi:molybdopterin synthase catalytic subunit